MISTMPFASGILSLLLLGTLQFMNVHGESSTSVTTTGTTEGVSMKFTSHLASTAVVATSSPGISKSATTTRTNTISSRTDNETTVFVTKSTSTHSLATSISTNISSKNNSGFVQPTPTTPRENSTAGTSNWTSPHSTTDVMTPGITNISTTISNVTSHSPTVSFTNGTVPTVTSWPTNSTHSTVGPADNSPTSVHNVTMSSTVPTTSNKNTTYIPESTAPITARSHKPESTPKTTTQTNNSTGDLQGNQKDSHNSTGVIVGAIIGSILGVALLGLVAYFICGVKKADTFSHRRLYEDIRNEPVLRLDNTVDPYDLSYGDTAFHNPTAVDSSAHPNHGNSHDFIPMDDVTTSYRPL